MIAVIKSFIIYMIQHPDKPTAEFDLELANIIMIHINALTQGPIKNGPVRSNAKGLRRIGRIGDATRPEAWISAVHFDAARTR
jgi:hypothetical protein